VRAIPGVAAASLASSVPLQPPFQRTVFPEGEENASARTGTLAFANTIVPGHFQAIRIPLLRGRDFNDADRKGKTRVVVINEAMARRFWPSQDSIGKRFKFYGDQEFQTVIGLAANTKVVFVGEAPQAIAFLPLEQDYQPVMTLHVRTSGGPETLKGTIEREVQSLDRNVALTQVLTAPELLALSLWGPRMAATLLSIFGIVALILAAVGIYGVMSYSVNQRASEIGIRMALGAERSDVLRMVLRQGMTVVSIGLAAGLVVATIISSVLKSLLYGVGMLDIPTFAATAAVLVLVALVANYVPARRATKVDPVHLMRYE
jgi:putative ABC transport system permease protein